MGRGEDCGELIDSGAISPRSAPAASGDLAEILGLNEVGALSRDRSKLEKIPSRAEWKEREEEYAKNTVEKLREIVKSKVSSKRAWEAYLKLYSLSPKHSMRNQLFARGKLARAGVQGGVILSESDWAALGRRVKEEYADPRSKGAWRRDKKFSYDRDRDWDSTYACEMWRPYGYSVEIKDSNGDPILDENGDPKKRFIPNGFVPFLAYHEDATEAIDGGAPPPLPSPPWQEADGDPSKLLADLRERMLTMGDVSLIAKAEPRDGVCEWVDEIEPSGVKFRKLAIDQSATESQQAIGVLRALSQGDADDEKIEAAARESSVYVIASLYGIDTQAQSFPHLRELLDDGKQDAISAETHKRVTKILGTMDPMMRKLNEAASAAREERSRKRSTARKKSAEKMRKAATKNSGADAESPTPVTGDLAEILV